MAKAQKADLAVAAPDEEKLVKVQYMLRRGQIYALRAEAVRRASERRAGRLDASEVLREIIDGWLAKGGKRS